MVTLVLAHSPLTGPSAWGRLPQVLRDRTCEVVVLDVTDDEAPPYAGRYVARAALQLRDLTAEPIVLIGHSGAGYLLPQIGTARRAARQPVSAYVFLDAGIPHGRGATRMSLLRSEDSSFADGLEELLGGGGRFPPWTDEDLLAEVPDDDARAAVVASLRPRGRDFFTEPLPFPDDWPDAPCGFVQLSASYDQPARIARLRGWPLVRVEPSRGHFAACVDPDVVADALTAVLSQLR